MYMYEACILYSTFNVISNRMIPVDWYTLIMVNTTHWQSLVITFFCQPSLFLWIKKCLSQSSTPISAPWNFKLLFFYIFIQFLQKKLINKINITYCGCGLTISRSEGKSFPLSIPLFIDINPSIVGLFLTLGLWRLVCSIITE